MQVIRNGKYQNCDKSQDVIYDIPFIPLQHSAGFVGNKEEINPEHKTR
jgi:hypothetical protein